LTIWNWPELSPAAPTFDAESEIYDANFDSSSNLVVVVTSKKCIVINIAKGKTVWSIDKPVISQTTDVADFRAARFGAGLTEGYLFVVANARSRKAAYVSRWKIETFKMEKSKFVAPRPVTTLAVSNDGSVIAFAAADFSINIMTSNKFLSLLKIEKSHNFPITTMSFSPTGFTLVSGSADGTCNVIAVPKIP
ncbi:hypothetical protein HDU82_004000, partial [Entophlyctis luteolus]